MSAQAVTPQAVVPVPHYNPVAEVFAALVSFDRPVNVHQIRKCIPKIPEGTISSTLTKLKEYKVIDRTEGQRPALWRVLTKTLPKDLAGPGRFAHPKQPGLHRNRSARKTGKPGDVLITLPVGRKDTLLCTERDARALLAALTRLFGK